jgi:FkbM family methyltransferase
VTFLRRAASGVSERLGRNSAPVTLLRPAYDRLLAWSSGSRGLLQQVNDEAFRIDPRNRVHFPRVYEPGVWNHLKTNARPGQVSLNIGAHMGIYALALARWTAPEGRVFAFEPNPETRDALEKHVSLNGLQHRVEVLGHAVSDRPGSATFHATGQEGFSRLETGNPDSPAGVAEVSMTVSTTSVDTFCAERGCTPDWITIDVEGFEIEALEGARHIIGERGRGLGIIVEMHPPLWKGPCGPDRIVQLLSSLDLKPVALTGQTAPLAEYGVVLLTHAGRAGRAQTDDSL